MIEWLKAHLQLNDSFFAEALSIDPAKLLDWLQKNADLDSIQAGRLADLWQMFLHVLSATNFDENLASQFVTTASKASEKSGNKAQLIPWAGKSIEHYLKQEGPIAIEEVNRWLASFRFEDRCAPVQEPRRAASAVLHPRSRDARLSDHIARISHQKCDPSS